MSDKSPYKLMYVQQFHVNFPNCINCITYSYAATKAAAAAVAATVQQACLPFNAAGSVLINIKATLSDWTIKNLWQESTLVRNTSLRNQNNVCVSSTCSTHSSTKSQVPVVNLLHDDACSAYLPEFVHPSDTIRIRLEFSSKALVTLISFISMSNQPC